MQLRMASAVFGKSSCQLFRRSNPQVADDAAMHRVRIVKTDNLTYKVRAVRSNQFPALVIGRVIESADQFVILLWTGLDLECVDRAEIGGSDQLIPCPIRRAIIR